jgi:hypothetical protein
MHDMNENPWFFCQNDQQCGPISEDELRKLFTTAQLAIDTLVWTANLANWTPASRLPQLAPTAVQTQAQPPSLPQVLSTAAQGPSHGDSAAPARGADPQPAQTGASSYQERQEQLRRRAEQADTGSAENPASVADWQQGPQPQSQNGNWPQQAHPQPSNTSAQNGQQSQYEARSAQQPQNESRWAQDQSSYSSGQAQPNSLQGGPAQPQQARTPNPLRQQQQSPYGQSQNSQSQGSQKTSTSADEDYRRAWFEQQKAQEKRSANDASGSAYPILPDQPIFFPVSVSKFIIMSIATFGWYEMYWLYKNWKFYAAARHMPIRPVFRSWFFGVFYVHALFREMKQAGEHLGLNNKISGSSATWWIVIVVVGCFGSILRLLGMLSFIPLLGVQRYLIELNAHAGRSQYINDKYTMATWLALAPCLLLWAINILGIVAGVLMAAFRHSN